MTERSIVTLKNGSLLFGWGEVMELKTPSPHYPAWFKTDFFLKSPSWYTHPFYAVVEPDHFLLNNKKSCVEWKEIHSMEHFFNESKGAIISKQVDKIVPYTYMEAQFTPNGSLMLNHLLQNEQDLFIYGAWDDEEGFIGATPEILFEIADQKVTVYAVAGTARVADGFTQKEEQEHHWVIKGIKEKLETLGPVSVAETRAHPYHELFHLVTAIHLTPKNVLSFDELVRHLHPTAALGAYPKENGEKILKRWDEIVERGVYGAPFGYQFNGEARAYVAIRNIQWKEGSAKIFVGSGVTAESHYEQEWNEVCLKAQSVKELLGV
ncbi:MAG: chorismate-binding protein [Parachlamydiaceae bacterium]